MTAKNLSVIFGPTLLRHRDENRDLLEMNLKIRTIEYILNHIDKMFVIETIKSSTENRRVHLPPLQRGEDLSSILSSYDAPSVTDNSTFPAVPPRENAGYI